MMNRMSREKFDLRLHKEGGHSGGVVAADLEGSLAFVQGNSSDCRGRRYVSILYQNLEIFADRDDFLLTKDSPLAEWYEAAMKLLLSRITTEEFVQLIIRTHGNGYKQGASDGASDARRKIRAALGVAEWRTT